MVTSRQVDTGQLSVTDSGCKSQSVASWLVISDKPDRITILYFNFTCSTDIICFSKCVSKLLSAGLINHCLFPGRLTCTLREKSLCRSEVFALATKIAFLTRNAFGWCLQCSGLTFHGDLCHKITFCKSVPRKAKSLSRRHLHIPLPILNCCLSKQENNSCV